MRVTVDTSHDSHEDIKKVIRMLQNLVGDSQEIFTNQPSEAQASPIANIFGDTSASPQSTTTSEAAETQAQETAGETSPEETPQSTDDLFAELFSEDELKKMDTAKVKEEEEDEEEEIKPAKKKYDIEFY